MTQRLFKDRSQFRATGWTLDNSIKGNFCLQKKGCKLAVSSAMLKQLAGLTQDQCLRDYPDYAYDDEMFTPAEVEADNNDDDEVEVEDNYGDEILAPWSTAEGGSSLAMVATVDGGSDVSETTTTATTDAEPSILQKLLTPAEYQIHIKALVIEAVYNSRYEEAIDLLTKQL